MPHNMQAHYQGLGMSQSSTTEKIRQQHLNAFDDSIPQKFKNVLVNYTYLLLGYVRASGIAASHPGRERTGNSVSLQTRKQRVGRKQTSNAADSSNLFLFRLG
jgi:hypothetical protein